MQSLVLLIHSEHSPAECAGRSSASRANPLCTLPQIIFGVQLQISTVSRSVNPAAAFSMDCALPNRSSFSLSWLAIIVLPRFGSMASGETKSVCRWRSRAWRTRWPSSHRKTRRLFPGPASRNAVTSRGRAQSQRCNSGGATRSQRSKSSRESFSFRKAISVCTNWSFCWACASLRTTDERETPTDLWVRPGLSAYISLFGGVGRRKSLPGTKLSPLSAPSFRRMWARDPSAITIQVRVGFMASSRLLQSNPCRGFSDLIVIKRARSPDAAASARANGTYI